MLSKKEVLEIIEDNQNIENLKKIYEVAKEYSFAGVSFGEIDVKDGLLNFGWMMQGQQRISEFEGNDTNVKFIIVKTPIESVEPEDLLSDEEIDDYEQWCEDNEDESLEDYIIEEFSKQELEDRMYFVYEELVEREVFFKDWELIEREVNNILFKNASPWLSATEVSDILGITSRAVRLNCENGRYECRKAGGVWLIDKESIIESLR